MYSSELTNNRGWGLWISHPSRELHWSGGPPFENNYLFNIENMVINQDINYRIDVTKRTSDILIESSNPDLAADYLEVMTIKESSHDHSFNSIQCYAGYIYYISNDGISRITPSNITSELVQANLGEDYNTEHIKAFTIDKTTGTIFFSTRNKIHKLQANGVNILNMLSFESDSTWAGSYGSGILFTSPGGELFSIGSAPSPNLYRHYSGTTLQLIKSIGPQIRGAVIHKSELGCPKHAKYGYQGG